MRSFEIRRINEDLTSHSGLALVGRALQRSGMASAVNRAAPLRHGIRHGDVLGAYIGLLSLGKHDFDAVEELRESSFFPEALGLESVPSAVTIRQRFDRLAEAFVPVVRDSAVEFLRALQVEPTPLDTAHVPLDVDVTTLDNSQTRKEGVSRTYHGYDGYAPIAAYIGREGYCAAFELREGKQHCQKGTPEFLERLLAQARRVTREPVLLRLDAGNDAIANMNVVFDHAEREGVTTDFIIKWNRREQQPHYWLRHAEAEGVRFRRPRRGKRVAIFSVWERRRHRGWDYHLRRVMRVTERTITAGGERLLHPEVEVDGWWTNLSRSVSDAKVIALYEDHGTSEQFHSEFKTDLGIERLPSGKFATNDLVLACATLAYNILRWLGQNGLRGPKAPLRHPAERRRLRTVMQELMYRAARVIRSGRRLALGFGRRCRVVDIFESLYIRLATT